MHDLPQLDAPDPGAAAGDLERRVAEIMDGLGEGFVAFDFGWRVTYCNRAAEAHFGIVREAVLGQVIWDVIPNAPQGELRRFLEDVMQARRQLEAEVPSDIFPGRWIGFRAFPLESGLGVNFRDVTEQREHAARLTELERRRAFQLEVADTLRPLSEPDEILSAAARLLGERLGVARVGYAEVSEDGQRMTVSGDWSPAGARVAGRSFSLPAFGARAVAALQAGEVLAIGDVTRDPRSADSVAAWLAVGARAILDVPLVRGGRLDAFVFAAAPEPREWSAEDVAVAEDVAGRTWSALVRARAEARQRLLINELNHRVKNTLATVQSIARQTLREAVVTREARERFNDRLLALSAAHNVLTRGKWEGAELSDIAREAVRPYDDPQAPRIAFDGPHARLEPNASLAVSMALHELATNAVKHGALSTPDGHVTVGWTFAQGIADLVWREAGGPPVAPPAPDGKGFGSRLLTQGLATELGAPAQLDFRPAGVVCRLLIPASV
ncbi:HWE histidine kinase domain-containing protein [Phenylobacterium sp.]|uniref:PAS domain-containing sensor histidine kinase n=1 Tax=Phenylobacterium sp. TaxID=1871053 RepID=UPI002811C53D|nr:HWE histidine kinase domain-containing protein [Phenylobacterium sp.]